MAVPTLQPVPEAGVALSKPWNWSTLDDHDRHGIASATVFGSEVSCERRIGSSKRYPAVTAVGVALGAADMAVPRLVKTGALVGTRRCEDAAYQLMPSVTNCLSPYKHLTNSTYYTRYLVPRSRRGRTHLIDRSDQPAHQALHQPRLVLLPLNHGANGASGVRRVLHFVSHTCSDFQLGVTGIRTLRSQ